ncbi:Ca2+-transporting ATPase [Trinickia symbiotica]|uniref:ATPase n=1 Tax=Trinickia symbiotica TaxID=863227 RepID=A0A2N7XB05_9BURK|nr:HAD-IC family P-type ATPase [Trinickia symbiotica]PMS38787.1 ATPase [Trinickia symbiotica]PPK46827.1 Ca2+-transporting ATPase [Trinickia symbiotica]
MNGRSDAALATALTRAPGEPAAMPDAANAAVVLHSAVPGRARLHVPRLYRDEAACNAFAQSLTARGPVRRVEASSLTGNALIWFDPAIPVAEIAALAGEPPNGFTPNHSPPSASASESATARVLHPPFAAREQDRKERARTSAGQLGQAARPWHVLDAKEVLLALGSSRLRGLSEHAARRRRLANGPNRLQRPQRRSPLAMFVSQFKSLPVALLASSAVVSIATGGLADALLITGVVIVNAVIGYATEAQTERAIDALSEDTERHALVLRNGALRRIDASDLVVGDILVLSGGAYVPADARVIEARQLSADESALTGESVAANKSSNRTDSEDVALADRTCMVYMGTTIVTGNGLAVVVAIGRATEIGLIQTLVGTTRPPATPMQRQMERLGNQTVRIAAAICGLVFVLGLLRGRGLLEMFKASVSLAVAAVPEGLPTVATTTLALGIRRMRRQNVLVRRLDAVETLGAVHTVCFDKTGTLTVNRMRVLAMHANGERSAVMDGLLYSPQGRIDLFAREDVLRLMHVAVLCNEVQLRGTAPRYRLDGSSTEIALVELALAAGIDVNAVRMRHPQLKIAYRAEDRNYMCTLHRHAESGGHILAVKGNPVEVLALCDEQMKDGQRLPLDDENRRRITEANVEMGGSGLRLLGFAYASGDETLGVDSRGLCWLGMLGLADPIREGAKELIALFERAGIKTVIITGDQSVTAQAIGKTLGIGTNGGAIVVDSTQINGIDEAAFAELAADADIFARASAAQKLSIVRRLQRQNQVIAMVGDGVNDGPALKAADISVAMGRHSTDLAREVADVVLEDDDLQTLTIAMSQGRTIYNNIRKSVHFLVSTNMSEIIVTLSAFGLGIGQPLTPMQLLWINLLSDVFPALALAVEPPEPDVLQRPPRDPGEAIVQRADMLRYGKEALAISGGALASHAFAAMRHGVGAAAGTVSFMTLTLAQLLHAYSCRSSTRGALSIVKRPRNRQLDLAIGGSVALQLLASVTPGLNGMLGLSRIDVLDALAIAAGATAPYLLNESTKPALAVRNGPREPR